MRINGVVRRCIGATLVLGSFACSAEPVIPPDYAIAVGEVLDITFQRIGPGMIDSLPTISSSAVAFVDAAVVPPYNPGGPRQRFRFSAVRTGVAVITFRDSYYGSVATKTVEVR